MQLVSRSSDSHWYRFVPPELIEPCYEVPKADNSGMTKTTLAHARKQKLLVGISTIANQLPKPALNAWLQEQAIMAALTLPRREGEPLDEFARRAVEDMNSKSQSSRDFGTQIHQAIEDHLDGRQRMPERLQPYLQGFTEWAEKNIEDLHALELVVGDPALGIAGKLDIDCTLKGFGRTVLDVKTQGVKDGKAVYYDTFGVQLAAYKHCRERELPGVTFHTASIIIDSAQPGPVYCNVWLGCDAIHWKVFQNLLENWCYQNSFNPAQL